MVGNSDQIKQITIENADIPGIVSLIRHAEKKGSHFIEDSFISSIKGKDFNSTAKSLWSVLRNRINYIADGNTQKIQSPGALWKSKQGDCKSFAVFIASVLQKMCVPYELVLDRYSKDRPNQGHIYVKALGVTIDPVNPVFNSQDTVWKRETFKGIDNCSELGAMPKNGSSYLFFFIAILILINYE